MRLAPSQVDTIKTLVMNYQLLLEDGRLHRSLWVQAKFSFFVVTLPEDPAWQADIINRVWHHAKALHARLTSLIHYVKRTGLLPQDTLPGMAAPQIPEEGL